VLRLSTRFHSRQFSAIVITRHSNKGNQDTGSICVVVSGLLQDSSNALNYPGWLSLSVTERCYLCWRHIDTNASQRCTRQSGLISSVCQNWVFCRCFLHVVTLVTMLNELLTPYWTAKPVPTMTVTVFTQSQINSCTQYIIYFMSYPIYCDVFLAKLLIFRLPPANYYTIIRLLYRHNNSRIA
jgi:hypothetical protein